MRRKDILSLIHAPQVLLILGLLGTPTMTPAQSSEKGPFEVGADAPSRIRSKAFIEDPAALFATGAHLAEDGKVEEAKQVFETLIDLYPSLPEPYINLGFLLASEKQTEAAAEALERGIFSHPVCVAAFNVTLVKTLSPYSVEEIEKVARRNSAPAQASATAAPSRTQPAGGVSGGRPAKALDPEQTVHAWAAAWAAQEAEAFLSFYADTFRPEDGSSHRQWRLDRARRILRPDWIQVEISDLSLETVGGDHALARFEQSYRSDRFSDRVRKTLRLVKEGQGWRILSERQADPGLEAARAATDKGAEGQSEGAEVHIAESGVAGGKAQETALIVAAITRWADAWSRQDVDQYLTSYATTFTPIGGQSLEDWRSERRAKLRSPDWIDIAVAELGVTRIGADQAIANFRQDYRSSSLGDTVRKTLRLTKEGGEWKIISEASR